MGHLGHVEVCGRSLLGSLLEVCALLWGVALIVIEGVETSHYNANAWPGPAIQKVDRVAHRGRL